MSVITPQEKNRRSQPRNLSSLTTYEAPLNDAPDSPHLYTNTELLPKTPILTLTGFTLTHEDINVTTGVYNSPYIAQSLKPNNEALTLPEELEPLRPLILSQHEAFSQSIKDLGKINLTFSKMIEQKKDSYETLKNHKKPPRSLRIRCELTASPSYSSNPKFKLLKEKLQDTVTDFIEKGTDIITE
jgi:hypothetical protein